MLLKNGSRGKDVETLQSKLGIKVDGIFGDDTETAVKAYQSKHGLKVDGVVGDDTWSALTATSNPAATPVNSGSTSTAPVILPNMRWNADQQTNIQIILKATKTAGVTNQFAEAAILAIVSKESSFKPQVEASYRNTDAARIRIIFGVSKSISDDQINVIKKDDNQFFEMVYGYQTATGKNLGNTQPGDGAKFRGRGFNQMTGRYVYNKYGALAGVDLINNPELLNSDINVAAKVLIAFLNNGIKALVASGRLQSDYNASGYNAFITLNDTIYAYYNCNAGTGKTFAQIKADTTGGLAKALSNGPALLAYIKSLP